MKKITLACAMLISLGLVGCAASSEQAGAEQAQVQEQVQQQQQEERVSHGEILTSEPKGNGLELRIRLADSDEILTVNHAYDSTLVPGAKVRITDNGSGLKNVSTWSPRSYL